MVVSAKLALFCNDSLSRMDSLISHCKEHLNDTSCIVTLMFQYRAQKFRMRFSLFTFNHSSIDIVHIFSSTAVEDCPISGPTFKLHPESALRFYHFNFTQSSLSCVI